MTAESAVRGLTDGWKWIEARRLTGQLVGDGNCVPHSKLPNLSSMFHHLLQHGAISVGSGGALTTIVSHAATWTKRYRRLGEAVSDAKEIGLMAHAKPVEPFGRGTAYSLQFPENFDLSGLEAVGFVAHGQPATKRAYALR
jgi:hypothetical protein